MNKCYDQGTLRAYVDAELATVERAAVTDHLAHCASCRADLDQLHAAAQASAALLKNPDPPDPSAALAHFTSARLAQTPTRRRTPMQTTHRPLRRWLAPLAAVMAVAVLLALPPVRAAADQVLQIFRVQTVMFVPVSQERIQQLESINLDDKSLFVAEPKVVNQPAEPRAVASADEASSVAGFAVEQPAALAGDTASFSVSDRTITEFQVDVATARQLLLMAGVDDVTLPDSLGAQPITVDMSPMVMARYSGSGYTVQIVQARSPQVTVPEGVDLAQLGRAALRVLGMAPEQAEALSRQIDWSTTLIFPFPADLSTVRQVAINGAPGMLMTSSGRTGEVMIYWQRGERLYVLELDGQVRGEDQYLTALRFAESLR